MDTKPPAYCWISSARYPQPLDTTTAKKWRMMAEGLGVDMRVIGFAEGLRPRRFTEHAHFYLLPQPPLSMLRYLVMFSLAPLLVLWLVLRHDVRVFIAQSPYEGAIGAFIKRLLGLFGKRTHLIVESHNDFEGLIFLQRRVIFARLYGRLMGAAARYALRHADVLRSISQATHDQLMKYAPDTPIVRFITWTDSDAFLNTKRTVPLAEATDIVYAGMLVPGKGVHHLLDTFAELHAPDTKLILVGKHTNADYTAQLREQAERLRIADRVDFVGAVTQVELARFFAAARVMVLPSLSEGLGRVVVEAMLCGTPVVASRVGGIPEMVTDGENGYLVPPGDADALRNALQRIMDDPDIEVMGKRAYDFASQFFSTDAYAEGYRQLFEKVNQAPDAIPHETKPHA